MLKYDQKYIVADLETTGLNLRYSRPWELSYLICQGNNVLDRVQIYIDLPNFNLSNKIKKLCNFDEKKYDLNKVSPEEAWERFKKVLYDDQYMVIGQNILKYDVNILNILVEMCGEELDFSFIERILDTRPLAVAHKSELEKPRNGTLIEWQYKVLNDRSLKARAGQASLLKFFGIDHDPEMLHDALYDVEMTWEIFKCLRKCLKL